MNLFDLIPSPYRLLTQAVLILALLGGTYYKGYSRGHSASEKEIATYANKLTQNALIIERQQAKINEFINDSTHAKIDTVYVRVTHNVSIINDVPGPIVVVHDSVSVVELPIGWVSVYNASARGDNADSAFATNGEASGIATNDALRHVVQNFAVCEQNAIRLKSLQDWIKQTQVNVESKKRKGG